jgi:hypothetical protein
LYRIRPEIDGEYRLSEKDGKHPGFREQDFSWAEKWGRLGSCSMKN